MRNIAEPPARHNEQCRFDIDRSSAKPQSMPKSWQALTSMTALRSKRIPLDSLKTARALAMRCGPCPGSPALAAGRSSHFRFEFFEVLLDPAVCTLRLRERHLALFY